MRLLALDFGNTHIKAGSFNQNDLSTFKTYENIDLLTADKPFILGHEACIICSVTQQHEYFLDSFKSNIPCHLFNSEYPQPLKIEYHPPQNLGADRLAASLGAWALYTKKNILCIDIGTCIKYNVISNEGVFKGGAISPGLSLRLKAMNHFTAKLPLLDVNEDFGALCGKNTSESMLSGAMLGAVAEVDGMIDKYSALFPELTTIITGGHRDFFAKHLKNKIFALPHLVLMGLHYAFLYAIDKKK